MTHMCEQSSEDQAENEPQRRPPGEVVFALLMLIGAAVLMHQAWTIAGFSSFSSPGVFPMLAAGTLVLSGVVIVIRSVRASHAERGESLPGIARKVIDPRVVFIGLLITGYLFLLQPLGFVISSVLFLSLALCGLHRRNYALMIGLSVVIVTAIHLLFRYVFVVVLPQGTLI